MKKILILLLLSLGLTVFGAIEDSTGTRVMDDKTYVEYMVSPGETIYRISTHYGVSISQLMEINPSLENGLRAGQMLLIPYNKATVKKDTKPAVSQFPKAKAEITPPKTTTNTSTTKAPEVKIKIEDKKGVQKETKYVKHTVKEGENLYDLSKKYNVSIGDLLKWNGLEVKEGQELIVGEEKEIEKKQEEKIVPEKDTDVIEYTQAESKTVAGDDYTVYDFDKNRKQVLIVPFDPHLYFSDSDDEMARGSGIPRLKVRDVFRRRLNTVLAPRGYEPIYLLGGQHADTLTDLNKVYSSVSYEYQDQLLSSTYQAKLEAEQKAQEAQAKKGDKLKGFMNKAKDKIKGETSEEEARIDKFLGKYFGVKINDPRFFSYFDQKYSIDYYIFVSQFEVKTDYEHCLDRSSGNYVRYFITHFTIFDKEGNKIAGNKFKMDYNSNTNNVSKIVSDNMIKIAERVLAEIPPAY